LQKEDTILREADYVQSGNTFCLPLSTPIGNIGSLICFDLRFPQQSTLLRQFGAEILTYPSVFTAPTGKAHWHTLLKSRAIENQCYVIAAAQVGKHNHKRSSYGHSLVVDPWGRILCDLEERSPAVEIVEIDLDLLNNVRKEIPLINCFRNDMYLSVATTKRPIDREFYMFGNIKIPNSSVFYETEYSIGLVNLRPIVPGRKLASDR
jgi:deaminated glutathione amidase